MQQHGLSALAGSAAEPVERRAFVAAHAGDIWYGDVMHGPKVAHGGRVRKSYLVSFMDDASRLITHSAFCLAETAMEVEGVLKQALLKRGLPKRIVIDNGAAYRAASLQGICARLEIRLVYCRPYAPEGKGKLERYHRTLRNRFLAELNLAVVRDLADLNARLWAWLEESYHQTPHRGLEGVTPLARYRQDLVQIRPLGAFAPRLDELFHHRHDRRVRKDGTVSYEGRLFEVPYELTGTTVTLVVEPQTQVVVAVESATGKSLGPATPLDPVANNRRRRRSAPVTVGETKTGSGLNLVELTLERRRNRLAIPDPEVA